MTDFAEAYLHRPEDVVAAAARTLDFSQPIALLLMGVMGHLEDGNAYPIVRHLVGALPPGSYLALYDGGTTSASDAFTEAVLHRICRTSAAWPGNQSPWPARVRPRVW
jgi:hypothetical protein